ncbi:hypothetical protein M2M59_14810 [Rummeliibacillus sp. G93]|uniref:Uncharacterized protein n=1 Tax=Rummeliibacillus stabekisii TaxID=241244 RepID=A0A143HFJ4_9BACL|nr:MULTISPECIES: hypothetical protein [Rummeliibacillus]AMX00247.1 hypothetical protein ATY39_13010 [Rummeliibacillus stabekisii]MBB5171438.1 putative integral membrane protein [Rummeliibacillus stabekisii]MCM3317829.1 hypothetical protein [Rummeliibacillus stabekisii]UQW97169.1 hypothetical protein M2M59_14810 [Rummeliibacillus sp. G93]GEL05745.1 hypothetical protein RST01_23720 [Rummeliibacillus stabekisii]
MLKGLPFYVVLIAIGSLSITFAVTRDIPMKMQWVLLIGGTLINIISLIALMIFLAKSDRQPK